MISVSHKQVHRCSQASFWWLLDRFNLPAASRESCFDSHIPQSRKAQVSFHMFCEILSSYQVSGFTFILSGSPSLSPILLTFPLSSPPSSPFPSPPSILPSLLLISSLSPPHLPQCFWHVVNILKAGGERANSPSFPPLWFPLGPPFLSLF